MNFVPGGQPFSLYLRANSPELYSIVQVNTLPTITSAIMIVAALIAGVAADRLGEFWIPAFVTTIPVFVGMILLNVWDVGKSGRLAAFMLQGFIARKFFLNIVPPPDSNVCTQHCLPWGWAGPPPSCQTM